MLSERVSDRFLSIGLYALIAIGMIWLGSRMINHVLDAKFYHDCLSRWEVALMQYRHQSGSYPKFSGGNHQQYMEKLVHAMTHSMTWSPVSNTDQPFIYLIDKIGRKVRKVFILALSDRMVIYNLSFDTIRMLDKVIDGQHDFTVGHFIGRKSYDDVTYIGVWKL
jgi:hypothetical protein